jgi:hypothetical protein
MSFRVGFDVSEENTGTPGPVPVRLIFAGNEIVTPLFGGFEEKGADHPPLAAVANCSFNHHAKLHRKPD